MGKTYLKNIELSPLDWKQAELYLSLLFNIILEILASTIGNKKVMEIRNGGVTSFLFTEELCLHRNP